MLEVPSHKGYFVDENGNVYSNKRGGMKQLKQIKIGHYLGISTYDKIKKSTKMLYIHRLVAETFIPNPENKPYVNHKDGNKYNNSVANLEWTTRF